MSTKNKNKNASEGKPQKTTDNINYIRATLNYESLSLSEDVLQIILDSQEGKITDEEARNLILRKYNLRG